MSLLNFELEIILQLYSCKAVEMDFHKGQSRRILDFNSVVILLAELRKIHLHTTTTRLDLILEALVSAVNECFHRVIYFLALMYFQIILTFKPTSLVSSSSQMVILFSSTQGMQNFIFAFPLHPSLSVQVFLESLLLVYISYINQVTFFDRDL